MPRPARAIMRECSFCAGDGEEHVYCEDCGETLFEDTVAKKHEDEICITCAANRLEDANDQR